MQLATIENANVITRTSANGRELGQRVHFAGSVPASQIKTQLKKADPKLTGRALHAKVNEVLTGKTDIAWMTYDALASVARSQGFIPDYADQNKAGTKIAARFIKPATVKAKAEAPAKDIRIAELEAQLAAIEAEKAEALAVIGAKSIDDVREYAARFPGK